MTYAGLKCLSRLRDAFGLVWLDAEAGFMPLKESEDLAARSVLFRALCQGSKGALLPQLSRRTWSLSACAMLRRRKLKR